MAVKTFKVPNISCEHCVLTIEGEIGELSGVTSVKASKDTKMVTVEWNEQETGWDKILVVLKEINHFPEEE